MTAREVMDEQYQRHRLPHETALAELTLVDRKGHREHRTLRRMDRRTENNLSSSLTVFDAPADIKGTALLTREEAGSSNAQWLYLPSQRRLQRIAQGRRNGYFMGTDFTFEDMDPEQIDGFAYRHLEEKLFQEKPCFRVEAIPDNEQTRASSGYGKRVLWIRKDILFVVKVEFYDRKDRLIKTQKNSGLAQLPQGAWRADRSVMDNHAKKHRTELIVLERDTAAPLPDHIFSERHLSTGRYMR
jgi:hypothetical protein